MSQRLIRPPNHIPTAVISIDDLYLTHQAQSSLAKSHPENTLIQHRGQPGTHDLSLAVNLLSDLAERRKTKIPSYDKSAFDGQGERVLEKHWFAVNAAGQPRIEIVILEGWCMGFRALTDAELKRRWDNAVFRRNQGDYKGRLGFCNLAEVDFVNKALREYDELTDRLDALIFLDALDPQFVYKWRQQQEEALRESKGRGMTKDQVIAFVNGYYPAYELYTDGLRAGTINRSENQLRLTIDEDRSVREVMRY